MDPPFTSKCGKMAIKGSSMSNASSARPPQPSPNPAAPAPASAAQAQDVARLLEAWNRGDGQAVDELLPLVYSELRALAGRYFRSERADHTLQPTALVHEAWLRLKGAAGYTLQDRAHFIGLAASAMRQILVDHARAHRAGKRGGGQARVVLDEAFAFSDRGDLDLVALDEALQALGSLEPRQARIVELRFFAGLTVEETAEALGLSPATVKRDWTFARAWLHREIRRR